MRVRVTMGAGFGSELKLSFSGSALIELNTTGVDKAPLNPADPAIKPGFKMVITAEVSFANFASATGSVSSPSATATSSSPSTSRSISGRSPSRPRARPASTPTPTRGWSCARVSLDVSVFVDHQDPRER